MQHPLSDMVFSQTDKDELRLQLQESHKRLGDLQNILINFKYSKVDDAVNKAVTISQQAKRLAALLPRLAELQREVEADVSAGAGQAVANLIVETKTVYVQLRTQHGEMCKDLAEFDFDENINVDSDSAAAEVLAGMQQHTDNRPVPDTVEA